MKIQWTNLFELGHFAKLIDWNHEIEKNHLISCQHFEMNSVENVRFSTRIDFKNSVLYIAHTQLLSCTFRIATWNVCNDHFEGNVWIFLKLNTSHSEFCVFFTFFLFVTIFNIQPKDKFKVKIVPNKHNVHVLKRIAYFHR